MDWRTATNADALAAWDKNEPIWSCDMAGMGPSYEQAIQLMAFEMLRAMELNPFDWATISSPGGKAAWQTYQTKIEKMPEVATTIHKIQPSGAQFAAAISAAAIFARHGYAKGMEMVPPDRRIQVQKEMPTLMG